MELPFTQDAFFALFGRYNTSVSPLIFLFHVVAAICVALMFRPGRRATLTISATLAAMWAVNGIGYHWMFFRQINPAAALFAAVFLGQALFFIGLPLRNTKFRFAVLADARSIVGLFLVLFATALYPLWGWLAGHSWPEIPVFGVAPCPTTIFTIGVLLTGTWQVTRWMLIVPSLWAAVGGSAAVVLGVPQDYALLAALAVAALFAAARLSGRHFALHGAGGAA